MIITETVVGKKSKEKKPVLPRLKFAITVLPYQLIDLLFLRRDDYFKVVNSEWNDVEPYILNGHRIERKVVGECGSQQATKFYQLRAPNEMLNKLLQNKTFGEFHYENDYGIFLRQFDGFDEWRTSYLVFIDTSTYTLHKLRKVNSTMAKWNYEKINEIDFSVVVEYTNTYLKKLIIRN